MFPAGQETLNHSAVDWGDLLFMNARPKINWKLDAVHYWASGFSTSCGIFVLAILASVVKYPQFVRLPHRLSLRTLCLGFCPPGFLSLRVEAEVPMCGAPMTLYRVETEWDKWPQTQRNACYGWNDYQTASKWNGFRKYRTEIWIFF